MIPRYCGKLRVTCQGEVKETAVKLRRAVTEVQENLQCAVSLKPNKNVNSLKKKKQETTCVK